MCYKQNMVLLISYFAINKLNDIHGHMRGYNIRSMYRRPSYNWDTDKHWGQALGWRLLLLLDVVQATQCCFQKFHLFVAGSSPRLVAHDEYHSVRVVVGVEERLSQRCNHFLFFIF